MVIHQTTHLLDGIVSGMAPVLTQLIDRTNKTLTERIATLEKRLGERDREVAALREEVGRKNAFVGPYSRGVLLNPENAMRSCARLKQKHSRKRTAT